MPLTTVRKSQNLLPAPTLKMLLFAAMLPLFALSGCSVFVPLPASETKFTLGTSVTITIHKRSKGMDPAKTYDAINAAFLEIDRIHYMAKWEDLEKINVRAGRDTAYVNTELVALIHSAYDLANETGWAFRPDMGPLMKLWGFETDSMRLPQDWRIEEAVELVDRTQFADLDSGAVYLEPKGAALDLGGVAKGYAVDRAVVVLREWGVAAGIVEAGGDLRAFGTKPGGDPWRVAVRNPRSLDEWYTTIEIDSGAVATSGDYERFFRIGETRYHHILDPVTGYPGRKSVSVTVTAPTCARADAYATAIFIDGPDQGLDMLWDKEDIEALVLYEDTAGNLQEVSTERFDRMRADNHEK
ncbi:hypothetical protein GF324_06225 [bacterium]|nr:hypothetical protein [bacterium]